MAQDALSALLDGECSEHELDRVLDELEHSPDLARQWSRMCSVRDARDGVRVGLSRSCLCASVMARLDAAPSPEQASPPVVDLASRRQAGAGTFPRPRRRVAASWRPLVGFAAAASVGAAAVFLLQSPPAAEVTRPIGIPAAGTLAHWDQPAGGAAAVQPVALSDDQAHAEMLREYLIDHSSVAASEGLGGTLRYARFAAHTADNRIEPATQP